MADATLSDLLSMTGYTVHTGSNEKFSQGWDQIFRGQASAKSSKTKADKPAVRPAKKSGKAPRKSK
jgi:hypothetical protein